MFGFKTVSAVAALALLGGAFIATPAAAQSADAKFRRGLVDVLTGFIELPGTVREESVATNPVQGMTVGLAKGLFRVAQREIVGVYQILTFPFAGDSNYGPILDPERAWHRFD